MPELPCRHSSWLQVTSNGVPWRRAPFPPCVTVTCNERPESPRQSGSAPGSTKRQKLSGRRDDEIDASNPGGGRRPLPRGPGLLAAQDRRAPDRAHGRRARSSDAGHHAGRGAPHTRGTRSGSRGNARAGLLDTARNPSAGSADTPAPVLLRPLREPAPLCDAGGALVRKAGKRLRGVILWILPIPPTVPLRPSGLRPSPDFGEKAGIS